MYRSKIIIIALIIICGTVNSFATDNQSVIIDHIINTTSAQSDSDKDADSEIAETGEILNTRTNARTSPLHPVKAVKGQERSIKIFTEKETVTGGVIIPIRHLVCVYRE